MPSAAESEQIAQAVFGLQGTATRLPGEYDDNFHLLTQHGKEYLLKISRSDANAAEIELQHAALEHLQQHVAGSFYIPAPMPALSCRPALAVRPRGICYEAG